MLGPRLGHYILYVYVFIFPQNYSQLSILVSRGFQSHAVNQPDEIFLLAVSLW